MGNQIIKLGRLEPNSWILLPFRNESRGNEILLADLNQTVAFPRANYIEYWGFYLDFLRTDTFHKRVLLSLSMDIAYL